MFQISHKAFHIPDFASDSRWAGNNAISLPSPSKNLHRKKRKNPGKYISHSLCPGLEFVDDRHSCKKAEERKFYCPPGTVATESIGS